MTTAPAPMAIAVLTRAQRAALHDAAARRARHLRKQAKRALKQPMPETEMDHLASEANTAALISQLTSTTEAIIIHTPTTGQPASLPEAILAQACRLNAAHTSNNSTTMATSLNELKRLIGHSQHLLLNNVSQDNNADDQQNADVPQNADNQMPPRTEEDIETIRAALDACTTGSTHERWQAQAAIRSHAEAYIEALLDYIDIDQHTNTTGDNS